ncbi:MAG: TonB-dependent receptor [Paludibacteraceae bacterium]|nr:TonB-dependent receptor [Paludibacteraceae bacterium]
MRKVLLSLSLFCAATASSMAMKVKGVVSDESGVLPGASVIIQGTTDGTETEDDGSFEIDANPGQVLLIEFTGYETKKVTVPKDPKKTLRINLAESTEGLAAVVVEAKQPYGGTGGVTGATTTLGADALKSATGASADNALQGKVPGVQANSASGQPGAPATIRIHGQSSLTGSGDPLYVVDGMPLGGGTDKVASSNPLASINPADIESMEVLKDASATAIYGSRAANGVIIITTKKGKSGSTKINYSGNFTVSQFTNRYRMMNLQEYARFVSSPYIIPDRQTQPDEMYSNPDVLGKGTDWQEELFQTAIGHSHQLSVNGGSDKTQYSFSLGYTNQEGVIITTDYQRINGRMNVESQVKDWFRIGMNVGISRQNATKAENIIDPRSQTSGTSSSSFKETDENIILQTLMQLPSDAPYNIDGSISGPETDQGVKMNPIARLKQSPLEREETNILGSAFAEFTILKDITWRNELGLDITNSNDRIFYPSYNYGGLSKDPEVAELRTGDYSSNSMRLSSYANYNKTFIKTHKVNFMLGAEANMFGWEGTKIKYTNFSSNEIPEPNMAKNTIFDTFYKGSGSMASFFGRINYSYKGTYDLSLTGRYDGSSNFASGNQWGFFPSIGLAWRISNESFIAESDLNKTITDLKLRLGYGETGNANCQPAHNATLSKWQSSGSAYDLYHYYNYINKDLSWETNKQFNVGLSFSLWNRIDFTFDAYHKQNSDLLLKPELPAYVAPSDGGWEYLNTAYVNAGSIKNVGFDIALHTVNIEDSLMNQPFTWDMDLTFSMVKNEVTDLGASTDAITEASDPSGVYRMFSNNIEINRSVKGEAPGLFYGYITQGIIQNTAELEEYNSRTGRNANVGDVKYSVEQHFIGDPNPDFTYGFGTNVSWGPWSLGIQLAGSQGNDVYNLVRQRLEGLNDKWVNQTRDVLDFARVDGEKGNQKVSNSNTSIPRSEFTNDANGNAQKTSDRYVEDGSFLKIQNVSLTYNLPRKYCDKIKVDNLHLSAGVSNIYTFTNYSGYDPENPGSAIRQGVDEGRYPSPRVYNVGLGFNF